MKEWTDKLQNQLVTIGLWERQRLVVCLDGTWNQQDHSTNVLHHFNLVQEDSFPAKGQYPTTDDIRYLRQRKRYFRGVGTGPLDRITGGGFGFGLEQNVRDAYNWLVETYRDQTNREEADEIFIFGFSRGAYTARSLVGFIAACGLLRRGAPLTVEQLWQIYCTLGRKREGREGIWEKLFHDPGDSPRQFTDFSVDSWMPPTKQRQLAATVSPRNRTEHLLKQWSRRVKITFLGVYDTVGAIGWDALAIPGLRSKLALHHNMRPTTLIQNCRHALAIDENRSSFQHTPFTAYLGHPTSKDEAERGLKVSPEKDPKKCQRLQAMWNRKIQQRWFVGAHSNIGGGYPDNLLARRPIEWLFKEAKNVGLACEDMHQPTGGSLSLPAPRDSYAEFAKPLWTMVFRAKRNYRVIDPPPALQANRHQPKGASPSPGFMLKNINEAIDDTVFEYYKANPALVEKRQPPPNLIEYAGRAAANVKVNPNAPLTAPRQQYRTSLQALAKSLPANPWQFKVIDILALLIWSAIAGAGVTLANQIFLAMESKQLVFYAMILAGVAPFLADRAEHILGFNLALRGDGLIRRTMSDVCYWCRALGFCLFIFGVVRVLIALCKVLSRWIGNWFEIAAISGPPDSSSVPETIRIAGLTLLLLVGLAYLINALLWVEKPMRFANLGSTMPLQFCTTPDQVRLCLENWSRALQCDPKTPDSATLPSNLNPLRESLWRDLLGFIPLCFVVLGFGSWLGGNQLATQFGWVWLVNWWIAFPLTAAVADCAEDCCIFGYLAPREKDKQSEELFAGLVALSFLFTLVKFVAFAGAALLTLAAIVLINIQIARHPNQYGWRGVIGLSAVGSLVVATAAIGVWALIYNQMQKAKVSKEMSFEPGEKRSEYRE